MTDNKNWGGKREGQGRKPKADELKVIDKLKPLEESALNGLKTLIAKGDIQAIKLFMEYSYSKPKQLTESDTTLTINDFDLREHLGFKNDSTQ